MVLLAYIDVQIDVQMVHRLLFLLPTNDLLRANNSSPLLALTLTAWLSASRDVLFFHHADGAGLLSLSADIVSVTYL